MNINYCANSMIYNNKWSDTVTEYGLIQLIKYPTRVTKSSSSIIDHIYASDVISLSEVFVTDLSISDHYPICATISLHSYQKNSNAHKSIKYRSIKHFDQSLVQADLCNSDLIYVESYSGPNVALTKLFNTIKSVLDKHAPLKKKTRIKRDHQPEWVREEIKSLMYQKTNVIKMAYLIISKF